MHNWIIEPYVAPLWWANHIMDSGARTFKRAMESGYYLGRYTNCFGLVIDGKDEWVFRGTSFLAFFSNVRRREWHEWVNVF